MRNPDTSSHSGRQGLLSTLVRTLREQALLTQEELAQRSGLSVGTIRGLESGRIQRPRIGSVRMLANALSVSESELSALVAAPKPVGSGRARAAASTAVPAQQLPAAVAGFTGRAEALTLLDRTLAPETSYQLVITGTAGVGKTSLAVHWAHRVRDRFPDGQLYVNLRGFDPSGSPVTPAEAIRGFLDALQVSPQRIPGAVDAQAALYRSLLADRRMLVLLDNARDAEQVRPLLPGSPGNVVIVTSRNQLSSLVAAEGAHLLALDLLSGTEAKELLTLRLGAERAVAEPAALDELVAMCARLPLALAVVAARAAVHRGFSLADLVRQLRETRDQLDAFTGDASITDVRAVFSWSYNTLSPAAARLFRLLGLHPGPELAVAAVASLAALPQAQVRGLLAELARVHLIMEHAPGRYVFHDLLSAYAAELAHTAEPAGERSAARHRLFDHYLHTAHAAALLVMPNRRPLDPPAPVPGVTPELLADYAAAMTWLSTESSQVLAAFNPAADTGFPRHAWQLAWTMDDFLDRQGRWPDLAAAHTTGLSAATRAGDQSGRAYAHRGLARAFIKLGRLDEANLHLVSALEHFTDHDDLIGQAETTRTLAWVLWSLGHRQEGLRQAEATLTLYVLSGYRIGQARALNNLGWLYAQLGSYDKGRTHCEQALALQREIGDRRGEAATWDSLGYVRRHLGHHQEAITCYENAAALLGDFDDRHELADALTNMGDSHLAAGQADAARDAWRRALDILTDLGHTDADGVRARIQRLGDNGSEPVDR
ncbi:ATP-binding protein [Nonomuraea antimicrobica]